MIGNVKDKTAVVVDDFITSGGTPVDVSVKLMERGAKAVYALVARGVLGEGSLERIDGRNKTILSNALIASDPENLEVICEWR